MQSKNKNYFSKYWIFTTHVEKPARFLNIPTKIIKRRIAVFYDWGAKFIVSNKYGYYMQKSMQIRILLQYDEILAKVMQTNILMAF